MNGSAGKKMKDWAEGEVAVFSWLHEDTARRVKSKLIERKDKGNKQEQIVLFEVEGKPCPCLILGKTGTYFEYFRIVRLTERATDFRVDGVKNLKGASYLTKDLTKIRWIHRNLAVRWIGTQDPVAYAHVLKELSMRGLHVHQ